MSVLIVSFVFSAGCARQLTGDSEADNPPLTKRIEINPNEEFELGLGDTVVFDGSNFEITFSFVSTDSRCPADVQCVWAGNARIILSVNGPDVIGYQVEASIPGLVPTPFAENDPIEIDGFTIRLLRLNPYPSESTPQDTDAYRALLVVES